MTILMGAGGKAQVLQHLCTDRRGDQGEPSHCRARPTADPAQAPVNKSVKGGQEFLSRVGQGYCDSGQPFDQDPAAPVRSTDLTLPSTPIHLLTP
jgi:hypothetical protein